MTLNTAPEVTKNFEKAADLLTEWGLPIKKRAGYTAKQARKDVTFAPKGVINHHTGSSRTSDRMLFDDGNGVVDGPLCHFTIYPDGTIVLGAVGYANHAGNNDKPSVDKVIAGPPLDSEIHPGADDPNYSGNRRTVGIEVKASGSFNAAQRTSAVALNAALVLAFGWSLSAPPVGAHKEITKRKPGDPGDDMAKFRRDVVSFISDKLTPVPLPEEETPEPVAEVPAETVVLPPVTSFPSRPAGAVPSLRDGDKGVWVKYLQRMLILKFPGLSKSIVSTGGADGYFGSGTVTAVKLVQKVIGATRDGVVGPRTWGALFKYGI